MSNRSLAHRYAQALFMSAREQKMLDSVEQELSLIVNTTTDSEELQQLTDRPLVSPEEKKKVFQGLFSTRVSALTMNFVNLVFDKRRERYLRDMLDEYVALANNARGLLEAEVKSAMEVPPKQQELIKARLSEATGRDVHLNVAVEPGLLGGVVIRIGDTVYDGSATQKLQSMKRRLVSAQLDTDRGDIAT